VKIGQHLKRNNLQISKWSESAKLNGNNKENSHEHPNSKKGSTESRNNKLLKSKTEIRYKAERAHQPNPLITNKGSIQ
jgi:hypothetical protein